MNNIESNSTVFSAIEFSLSVIIATSATTQRGASIKNAIQSIFSQQNLTCEIIVVANGNNCNHSLLNDIRGINNIQLFYMPELNVNTARLFGRHQVKSAYFCFLDDDDEFLPDTLYQLVITLAKNNQLDAVVGNGVRHINGTDKIRFEHFARLNDNQIESLVRPSGNWLASCAGVYRSAAIENEFFSDYPQYCEWTYFAFKLSLFKKVMLLDVISYRINDSEGSLSKSIDYLVGEYRALLMIQNLPINQATKTLIARKLSDQAHSISCSYLSINNIQNSLKFHFISLKGTYGIKYILYTRKILTKILRNTFTF